MPKSLEAGETLGGAAVDEAAPFLNRGSEAAKGAGLLAIFGVADENLEWMDRALCTQTDPEAFFPEKGQPAKPAKRVCLSCEVREDCLEYALTNDIRHGIWGGLSDRQRIKLKKRAA